MSAERLIIRTKLFCPPLPPTAVRRERLTRLLSDGSQKPLILVSAPAGFGKTTLVGQWLEEAHPDLWAWLSLDQGDDDLGSFLAYLIAALRSIFPDACAPLEVLTKAEELPEMQTIAAYLINGMHALDQDFYLVLDDFHLIREPRIHELMNRLLEHPPHGLHFIIVVRRDPPLRIASLRALGQVTEIRMTDLQLTASESEEILRASWGGKADPLTLRYLHERTEGWAAGLKLIALSLGQDRDLDELVRRLESPPGEIQDYLVAEVLAGLSPEYQDLLLLSSIFERFSAQSCNALLDGEPGSNDALVGEDFMLWLQEAEVFCVSLDEVRQWFRFHHLFRKILQRHLIRTHSPEEIRGLHGKASRFFEGLGWIEEAMNHALLGPGPEAAADLLVRHRDEILAQELWFELDRWFRMLPSEQIEGTPELLMLQAWNAQNRYRREEMVDALDRVEQALASMPSDVESTGWLQGEWSALTSYLSYLRADADLAIHQAEKALELLPESSRSQRGYAMIILAAALQMAGRSDRSCRILEGAMRDISEDGDVFQARVLASLCFVQWMDADCPALARTAARHLKLGRQHGLAQSIVVSSYFLGAAWYSLNELDKAERILSPIAAAEVSSHVRSSCDAAFALALIQDHRGRHREARKLAERTTRSLEERNNSALLLDARAFEAELALRQEDLPKALAWARSYDPEPFFPTYRFRSPALTQAKVFLAHGSEPSLDRAARLIERLCDFYRKTHNRRFLVETLAVDALLHSAQGDETLALDSLRLAVQETRSLPMSRIFVDLGPKIRDLLNHLPQDERYPADVQLLLASFSTSESASVPISPPASPASLIEPLTPRQEEILELLGKRLSNKEIGARLHISSGTVKRHCENLYDKLGVRGRREVVARARELSLL